MLMSNLDIDVVIFVAFLSINVILGIMSSYGIRTIKEYAVGDRNFSTATIVATLVATWVSGDTFFTQLSETYNNGLYFMWAQSLGELGCFLLIGYFFAPRLAEFLGTLSIADAMRQLYGKHVGMVTAVAGFIGATGMIAIQLKVSGLLFEYAFNISDIYGIITAGVIITLYSSFGGIKSVTFTDIIQLFTFGTIIPTIAFFILGTIDNTDILTNTLQNHKLFNYHEVFDFSSSKSLYYLFLFLFIAIPGFNPAIFQRIVMAKNTKQIRSSFIIAGFTCTALTLTTFWVSILVLSSKPNLALNDVFKHILFDYSFTGLKGLTLIGVMAMVMSTADSYINSTSILIVHDFLKPLGLKMQHNKELVFSRIASLVIGIASIILATKSGNLLHLLIAANLLYMPIVTVPFIMATLGFRTSNRAVLIGMSAGLITVLVWEIFLRTGDIDAIIPGMTVNLFFLLASHYLLKEPGGWVGIKDDRDLVELRLQRKVKIEQFINYIKNFRFVSFLRQNTYAAYDTTYVYFGLFCIISIYSTIHTLSPEIKIEYNPIIRIIHPSVLLISTIILSYPLWLQNWKEKAFINALWNFSVFYILICVGVMLVIISNFAQLQLMAFMVNMIVVAVSLRWQWALFMMISGIWLTIEFFKYYIEVDHLPANIASLEFYTSYLILLISSILIIFLKPRQDHVELVEHKLDHLKNKVDDQEDELTKSHMLKNEFVRNLEHEAHTPITGITSMGQVLYESYDILTDQQRKDAIGEIAKSSERLRSFVDNLIDLSKLSSMSLELNKEEINLSYLVVERLEICKKLYLRNKPIDFQINKVNENVILNCDKYYISSLLDNLIVNAINYTPKGTITLLLNTQNGIVTFSIKDDGIGIPKTELYDIFNPFTVSSKTKTPSGGRGIGLTLCKKIIDAHDGKIWAESDGKQGAIFSFNI